MKHDAINIAAIIIITSFAVERITSGLLFLLSFFKAWQHILPDPGTSDKSQTRKYEKRRKLFCHGIAGAIALVLVLNIPSLSVLAALEINAPALVDLAVSWLVLVAGSDRIFELISKQESVPVSGGETKPLVVTGTLTLESEAKATTAGNPRLAGGINANA